MFLYTVIIAYQVCSNCMDQVLNGIDSGAWSLEPWLKEKHLVLLLAFYYLFDALWVGGAWVEFSNPGYILKMIFGYS